jgi:hypothetical protein
MTTEAPLATSRSSSRRRWTWASERRYQPRLTAGAGSAAYCAEHRRPYNGIARAFTCDGGSLTNSLGTAQAILFGALLGSVGCGGEAMTAEGFETEEAATGELGTLEQALGGNWRQFTQTPNQSGGFTGDPAVCNAFANQGGWAAIGRSATSNKLRWSILQSALPATAWANLGDRVFNSSPACAALDEFYQAPSSQWSYQKAILGRDSSNNRYYIRVMKIPPGVPDENNVPLPTVPRTVLDWTSISNSAYVSGPGAAVVGGALVVCGKRTVSSSTRAWCKYNTLSTRPSAPFDNSNWTPGAEAPALPSGWTAQGDPAVVNSSHVFPFAAIIAVRATRKSGQFLFTSPCPIQGQC